MQLPEWAGQWLAMDAYLWLLSDGWQIALIIVLAWLGNRLLIRLVDRLFSRLGETAKAPAGRVAQRAHTLAAILKSSLHLLIWVLAAVTVLERFMPIGPLLASIGVLGLGLSLGAQGLVRDFLGGFFILLEDQYGVGDVITVNSLHTGTVEAVSLRVTRLRNLEGQLITIPNGNVQVVYNMSNEWARIVLDVPVPYNTDLQQAFLLLEAVLQEFYRENREALLEVPELLGVEKFAESAILVRLLARTAPLRQWEMARRLRLLVKEALDREGIAIPLPQMDIHMHPAEGK